MRQREAGGVGPPAALDAEQAAAADAGLKSLVPVPRPFLDYVLSGLADAGIEEVCLIVGPDGPSANPIRERYAALPMRRLAVSFAVQETPRGTADAALAAEEFAAGADFLLANADNYYPLVAYRALTALSEPGLPVFERDTLERRGNVPSERVAQYATLRIASDGYLARIDEKPGPEALAAAALASPGPVLVSMNLWRFSSGIFEACRRVPVSERGERELPQAVQFGIDALGLRFRAVPCAEGVLDLSTPADIASVARALDGIEVRL
ncbi:MAG TPA: sugar phosphate nucleotidyltransferase [Thermoanaerobaculia bacterium]|jgi:glucose-1-phosphate thymidylyltransferase